MTREHAASGRRPPRVYASVLVLIGLILAVGGSWLVILGGSPYYLVAGAATIVAAILLWRGDGLGAWLFLAVIAGTIPWAILESGDYFWALLPRIAPPAVLGLWLLTALARRGLDKAHLNRPRTVVAPTLFVSLLAAAVLVAAFFRQAPGNVSPSIPFVLDTVSNDAKDVDWRHYGNTLQGTRYSPLAQITPENVSRLEVAWVYRSGDLPKPFEKTGYEFRNEATPLKVGEILYTCTAHNIIVALDVATGHERWRYDPKVDPTNSYQVVCRGVAWFEAPAGTPECPTRIIEATIDARLIAVDAMTGRACESFGTHGEVDLRYQMEPPDQLHFYFVTSPPTIARGKVVVGGQVADNQSDNEPSGVIRAFDAVTGRLAWAWDVGHPDRIGAPPPGEFYTPATPNSWTIFAADEQLGLVYVPMGNATPDFWGGHRRPFDEEYGDALVALDLENGRPRWHFQTVHKDRWDYDLPAQPILTNLPTADGVKPAIIQVTKVGDIYVLDRTTGKPIAPVIEELAPQGPPPGDTLSPTQPASAISLRPAKLTEADMWGVTPLDQLWCRIQFRRARYDGTFTAQGLTPAVIHPGQFGITDWGGASIDEVNKILVMNSSGIPFYDTLVPRERAPKAVQSFVKAVKPGEPVSKGGGETGWGAQAGTPFAINNEAFLNPLGVPCNQPPWGYMNAFDLKTGRVLWRSLLGTAERNGPLGIPSYLPLTVGVPNIGGTVTTAGGLIFVGAAADEYFRAFDLRTGREVWKVPLPAGGQATPMSYESGGRQFVVITAGGHSNVGTRIGDYTIAYALAAAGP